MTASKVTFAFLTEEMSQRSDFDLNLEQLITFTRNMIITLRPLCLPRHVSIPSQSVAEPLRLCFWHAVARLLCNRTARLRSARRFLIMRTLAQNSDNGLHAVWARLLHDIHRKRSASSLFFVSLRAFLTTFRAASI